MAPSSLTKNTLPFLKGAIMLLVVGSVAVLGVKLLQPSKAATGLAVPVPNVAYWGVADATYSDGAQYAPSSCQQGGQTGIECELTWAAQQQNLTMPRAAGSDGYLHNTLLHDYVACDNAAQLTSYKNGGAKYAQTVIPGRYVLVLNMNCADSSQVNSGSKDASIKAFVDALDTLPIPVILTYYHEPEDDPCSATANPDLYRAAYRHFAATVSAEEAANGKHRIDMGFILSANTFGSGAGTAVYSSCTAADVTNAYINPENWWPGDDVVDWIGSDSYIGNTFAELAQPFNSWGACPAQHPSTNYNCTSARASKPKMLAEIGYGPLKNAYSPTATASWMDGMHTAIKTNTYSSIKAFAWYKGVNTMATGGGAFDPSFLQAKALARISFDSTIAVPSFGTSQPAADTTKPTVQWSAPANGATVSGTVAASATASDNVGVVQVNFLLDGTIKQAAAAAPYTYTFDSTSLSNGAHTLQAQAVDAAGNSALSSKITITIANSTADTAAPSKPVNISSSSQTTNSITLAWSASSDPNNSAAQISYHISRNGTEVGATAAGATNFTDTGLSPATTYSYTIVASDPAGNRSAASAAFTQATKSLNCAAPAAPANVSAQLAATSVRLAWSAVAPPSASCTIKNYVIQLNGVIVANPASTSYTSVDLLPATHYSFSVFAVTVDNTAGSSTAKSVSTLAASDSTPPSVPTGLSANAVSSSQINLSWAASSDPQSSIRLYHILRNGREVGTATGLSFGDSGLQPNQSYNYQVVAENGAGLKTSSDVASARSLPATTAAAGANGATPVIPILQGTTSVGANSDSGKPEDQKASDPTVAGAPSDNPAAAVKPKHPIKRLSPHRKIFAVAATIAGVILVSAGMAVAAIWYKRLYRIEAFVVPAPAPVPNPTSIIIAPTTVMPPTTNDQKENHPW